jgi:hypothetical protein
LDATAASDGGGDADDDDAAADDDNDDNDAAAPVGGAVAAAATITTTEDDAAADDEGGGDAADEVVEDGGGGGGDINWTTWHPLPPWPKIFNSLKVPRDRDFANYGPGHALAILFFYNPDLKSLSPNLNNNIHAGWVSVYHRAMTADGLNFFLSLVLQQCLKISKSGAEKLSDFYKIICPTNNAKIWAFQRAPAGVRRG